MRRRRSRGVAAIEFALVLAVFSAILAGFLYFGRFAMERAVLDRATTDAARYMATVPAEDLRDSARRSALLARTRALLEETLRGSGIQTTDLYVSYRCGSSDCGTVLPSNSLATVTVSATLGYSDTMFGAAERIEFAAYAEAGRGD